MTHLPTDLKSWIFNRALPSPALLTQLIPHPLENFGIKPTPNIQKGTIEESGLMRLNNITLDSTSAQQILHTLLLSLQEARKRENK